MKIIQDTKDACIRDSYAKEDGSSLIFNTFSNGRVAAITLFMPPPYVELNLLTNNSLNPV